MVKNLPALQETWPRSMGREDPLEIGMATHSSILAWRSPWTGEPGGLPSTGSYFCLGWVLVAAPASLWLRRVGATLQLQRRGFRCPGFALAVEHVGSVAANRGLYSTGAVLAAHRLSCSTACGIFPDQGSNLYLLQWQADSLPVRHQGRLKIILSKLMIIILSSNLKDPEL